MQFKDTTLKTYIFPKVWTDYTSGMGVCRASSQEKAIQMLLLEFDKASFDTFETKKLKSRNCF